MGNIIKFPESENDIEARLAEAHDAICDALDGRHKAVCVTALIALLGELLAEASENDCNNIEIIKAAMESLAHNFHLHCNCDDDRISETIQ